MLVSGYENSGMNGSSLKTLYKKKECFDNGFGSLLVIRTSSSTTSRSHPGTRVHGAQQVPGDADSDIALSASFTTLVPG